MKCERATAISAIGSMLIAGCSGGSTAPAPSVAGGGGGLGSTFGAPENGPAPEPEPGTANVALCNFTSEAVRFTVYGVQAAKPVTSAFTVPAYTYIWSTGWSAGDDTILTVATPYTVKTFVPFVTTDLVALFNGCG